MTGRYKHVMDCLETARNGRFCAGAEKAATEIERLQARNELLEKQIANMNHAAHAYEGSLEDSLKRQELLEKVVEAANVLTRVHQPRNFAPRHIISADNNLREALATLKEQT